MDEEERPAADIPGTPSGSWSSLLEPGAVEDSVSDGSRGSSPLSPRVESQSGWPVYGVPERRRTERTAVASLWCSIGGILIPPAAIVGIVLGFVGRSRINRSEGLATGSRLAMSGIVIGVAALGVWMIVLFSGLSPSSSPTSSPTSSVVVVEPFGSSSDRALARAELVARSAYPAGWTGVGGWTALINNNQSYFSISPDQTSQLDGCLGLTMSQVDAYPATAADQEYADPKSRIHDTYGATLWVNDAVSVFPTVADAEADAEGASNPVALLCQFRYWGPSLIQDLAPAFGSGEVDSAPTVLSRTIPHFGSHDADDEWSMNYTYRGKSGTMYADWVTVQKGRSESNLWLSNLGSPVPSGLITKMARAAERKMTAS